MTDRSLRPTRNATAFRSAVEDADAHGAALKTLRLKHDPEYRKRYGDYLRGQLDSKDLDGGETHADWWERTTADRDP